jgi:nitrogenase molybdenum-iron protein alpha/beta subunit
MVEITTERVDGIEETRLFVEELIEYADEEGSMVLDEENLRLLEAQLDAFHQAMSMAVAQKESLRADEAGDDSGEGEA